MAFESFIHIELHGVQSGQTCFNRISWAADASVAGVTSQAAAEWFETNVWPDLQALLCNEYRLMEIHATIPQTPGTLSKPTYILPVNEAGLITDSEPLPSNVVVNIVKVPDNSTIDPLPAENFRLGRIGFSGIPEASQADGLLASGVVSDWNDLGELLEEIELTVGGTPYTWQLAMYREPTPPATATTHVYVTETYVAQKIGTRNSRKR